MESYKLLKTVVFCIVLFAHGCVIEDDRLKVEFDLLKEEEQINKVSLADPFILVANETYYAYGTYRSNVGFSVFISNDLRSWKLHPNNVLYKDNVIGDKGFWAPEVSIINNKYYMYYTAEEKLSVAVSDSPLGPFEQSERNWIFDNIKSIDGSVYIEDDDVYLYFVETDVTWTNRIYVVRFESNKQNIDNSTLKMCLEPSQKWDGIINEGPTVVKVGKKYLMTYSGNGYSSIEYGVGVAVADDPMGPWEKYEGNPVMQYPVYKGAVLQGTGHNSLFKDLDGNWRMVFHAHAANAINGDPRYMYIVSVDLLDHPPYIVFHDDLFAPVLAEEDVTESSAGIK